MVSHPGRLCLQRFLIGMVAGLIASVRAPFSCPRYRVPAWRGSHGGSLAANWLAAEVPGTTTEGDGHWLQEVRQNLDKSLGSRVYYQ